MDSGKNSPAGAASFPGQTSASGSAEDFVYLRAGLSVERFHQKVILYCGNQKVTLGNFIFTVGAGPTLAVAVTTSAQKGKVAVGQTANVTLKVTANGGAVSSVIVVLASKVPALAVVARPPGSSGFSLGQGASRSFVFKVKGISSGLATLIASAQGKTAGGKTLTGVDSTKLRVGTTASVQVAFAGGTTRIGVAVGKTVDVPVVVTAGNVDLTAVSLGSGLLAANDKVRVVQPAGLSVFALAAGASRKFSFKVQGLKHGDSSLTARVTATSKEGKVSGSASLSVQGLFTIQGTVNTVTSCAAGSCPKKPLRDVSVVALPTGGAVAGFAAGGQGQGTTGADGSYSVDVPKGSYTVSPTLAKYRFVLPTRSVRVSGKDVAGVDFKACPVTAPGAASPLSVCEAPSLAANVKTVTKEGIVLDVEGENWDPQGGTITVDIDRNPLRLKPTTKFGVDVTIDRWPQRTSIPVAQARQNTNGYCWGEITARQGSSFATTGAVQGKWSGWVLWSGDPRIHAGQAVCDGEQGFLGKSPHPIVVFGTFSTTGNPTTLVVYNLTGQGSHSPPIELGSLSPVNINLPRYNTCVRVQLNANLTLAVATSNGAC